jgi:hypothetical protein
VEGVTDWLAGVGSVLKKYVAPVFFGRLPLVETGVIPFFDTVTMTDSSGALAPKARVPHAFTNRKAATRIAMLEVFFIGASIFSRRLINS